MKFFPMLRSRSPKTAGMKLDEFIYRTIAEITGGISRAQTELNDKIVINPILPNGSTYDTTIVGDHYVRLTELQFDVELTSAHGIEVSAATVAPAAVTAKGTRGRGGTSRVAFTLVVAFPAAVIDLPDTNPY